MITYEQIRHHQDINTYIRKADESLIALGFTEHSFAHVGLVAEKCRYILTTMGYSEREIELGQIAAYLHDIGNLVNRIDHSQSGAVMAFRILDKLGMDPRMRPWNSVLRRSNRSWPAHRYRARCCGSPSDFP